MAEWSATEELLAVLVEVVDQGNRLFLMANVEQGTPLPDPVQIHRPGSVPKALAPSGPRMASTTEMAEFFDPTAIHVVP